MWQPFVTVETTVSKRSAALLSPSPKEVASFCETPKIGLRICPKAVTILPPFADILSLPAQQIAPEVAAARSQTLVPHHRLAGPGRRLQFCEPPDRQRGRTRPHMPAQYGLSDCSLAGAPSLQTPLPPPSVVRTGQLLYVRPQ